MLKSCNVKVTSRMSCAPYATKETGESVSTGENSGQEVTVLGGKTC